MNPTHLGNGDAKEDVIKLNGPKDKVNSVLTVTIIIVVALVIAAVVAALLWRNRTAFGY